MKDGADFQGIIFTSTQRAYFPTLLKKEFDSYVKSGVYEGWQILRSTWLDDPVDLDTISLKSRQLSK
jgi:hypothetical protein